MSKNCEVCGFEFHRLRYTGCGTPIEKLKEKTTGKPKKYKKIPVEIEAMQFNFQVDYDILKDFIGESGYICQNAKTSEVVVRIDTLEGIMAAHRGDYIIKGVKGEFYAVRKDIFEMTYEEVVYERRI